MQIDLQLFKFRDFAYAYLLNLFFTRVENINFTKLSWLGEWVFKGVICIIEDVDFVKIEKCRR